MLQYKMYKALSQYRLFTPAVTLYPLGRNICSGRYTYMSDLRTMEETATNTGPQCFQPATPFVVKAWQQALAMHPDQAFAHYILHGLQRRFHIGADRAGLSLRPGPGNFPSVCQHPHLVQAHIAEEANKGRLLGPLPGHLVPLSNWAHP